MTLRGRIALVTGASRGIGRAIALGLAQDGADVAVAYQKEQAAAQEVVAQIEDLGRRARAYRASVESWSDAQALVAAASRELGPIDIFICNAGIHWHGAQVVDAAPEDAERILRVNALGPLYLCKLVLPGMRQCRRGDIVIVSSAATEYLNPGYAPYNMSKVAVETLAFTLAKEERPHGIHVNVIAPGLVETPMGRGWAESQGIHDMRKLDAEMPFGHVCQPEEVAEVARFLVSERASYVTGQRIYVHGGAVIRPE
jgi:NAD(P)-dependent dehydrogenase (short-subunit alcohol dehydrogenase family)